jgi:hypothetical protein
MDALATTDVTRPWHWGIAILSDPSLGGEIPDVDPDARVSANENGIVILVRHAQDVDEESFDDDVPWAEATVTIRLWPSPPEVEPERTVVFDGTLATPTRRIWIGDADEDRVLEGFPSAITIRVLLAADDLDSPDRVWVDAWPA